jgi:hypothetical protein
MSLDKAGLQSWLAKQCPSLKPSNQGAEEIRMVLIHELAECIKCVSQTKEALRHQEHCECLACRKLDMSRANITLRLARFARDIP